MLKNTFILLLLIVNVTSFAQEIEGNWYGDIVVPGGKLPLVLHITKTENGYSSTLDSPKQKSLNFPVPQTTFENGILKFIIPAYKVDYEGKLNSEFKFIGFFTQKGQKISLEFSRQKQEEVIYKRPQEPTKPYPYYSEEVTFENKKDGNTLAGTLTLPTKEGNFPVVILISGSGAQNREEEILGHKPFLIISDFLTKNGFAVLRYDDRGTAASTGNYGRATTLDFSYDTEAAVNYLMTRTEINKKKIGLIGHSEGGVIAPMVASRNKNVNFIVLLAGTGLRGDKLLLLQQELIAKSDGATDLAIKKNKDLNIKIFDLIIKSSNDENLKNDITHILKNNPIDKLPSGMSEDQYVQFALDQYTSTWTKYFIKLDPSIALKKVKCPVLAINGSKDLQVPSKQNLEIIKNSLLKGKNKFITVVELPNLNHLFQETTIGAISEYEKNEQTFSPLALKEILTFLKLQIK